jgi:hypothetical protein
MRNPDLRLMPDSVNVAAKVIDGEAVILDVTRGTYYSMDGAGAVVWAAIEQGHSLGTIVRILGERYDGTAAQFEQQVEMLTDQLLREGLVVPAEAAGISAVEPMPASGAAREPFIAPALNKYTDMADLLALDPPMPVLGNFDPDA